MSLARQAVIFFPSLTGCGYTRFFTPSHHALLETGISSSIDESLSNPDWGKALSVMEDPPVSGSRNRVPLRNCKSLSNVKLDLFAVLTLHLTLLHHLPNSIADCVVLQGGVGDADGPNDELSDVSVC